MHRPFQVLRLVGSSGVIGAAEHHVAITLVHCCVVSLGYFRGTILTPEVRTWDSLGIISSFQPHVLRIYSKPTRLIKLTSVAPFSYVVCVPGIKNASSTSEPIW